MISPSHVMADCAVILSGRRRRQENSPEALSIFRDVFDSMRMTDGHRDRRRRTMQYLMLIYQNEAQAGAATPAQMAAMHQEYGSFTQSIVKSGNFKGGDALQATSTATTVRVRDGKTVTTDGPFAETREQLAGYYMIEAKNLDEATSIAARVPSAKIGSIEVRPIRKFD